MYVILAGIESQPLTHFETSDSWVNQVHVSQSRETFRSLVKFNSQSLCLARWGINAWNVVESTITKSMRSLEAAEALSERRWGQTWKISRRHLLRLMFLEWLWLNFWLNLWLQLMGYVLASRVHMVMVRLYLWLHWWRHISRRRNLVVRIWCWWSLWVARERIWGISSPRIGRLVKRWAIRVHNSRHWHGAALLVTDTMIRMRRWMTILTWGRFWLIPLLALLFGVWPSAVSLLSMVFRWGLALRLLFCGRDYATCTSRCYTWDCIFFSWCAVDEKNLLCSVVGDVQDLRSAQQRYLRSVHKLEQFVFLFSIYMRAAWFFETFDHVSILILLSDSSNRNKTTGFWGFGVLGFWGKIQLSNGHKVSWFWVGWKILLDLIFPHVGLSSMPFWSKYTDPPTSMICGFKKEHMLRYTQMYTIYFGIWLS